MTTAAKWILFLFGIYIILAGFIMLLKPVIAREILRKAGSTNFINYAEISLRMLVSAAFIVYSEHAKYPDIFYIAGWFMLITSFILYMVPRKMHHGFSLKSAEILKPVYFQIISPFAFVIGLIILYNVF